MSVSHTISEIFSVKNGVTLKFGFGVVQDHSQWRRSIDHIQLSSGRRSAIVSIACLVSFASYLVLTNIVTLKYGLEVTQDHSNWYYSKAWIQFPIRLP